MNGRIVLSILLVLVLVALVAGIGVYEFNAGVAQGMVSTGKITVPEPGTAPYPYYGPFFYRPFGFGFGLFGCIGPLLALLLIFILVRAIIWRGVWGWHGPRYYWREGVPPPFEEWHRRAHESQANPESGK